MRKTTAGPNQLTLWPRAQLHPRKPAAARPAWSVTIAEHIQAAREQ